jgi:hypothetical protein
VVQNENNNVSEDQRIILQLCLLVKAKGVSNHSHRVIKIKTGPFKETSHSVITTNKARVSPEVRTIFEDKLQQEEVPETPFFPSFRPSRSFHGCLKENPASLAL